MEERWKPIKGYEGIYSVSDRGNVYSLRSAKILTPIKTRAGYLRVHLSVNGNCKSYVIHRLVALAFIPNPLNKPTVNHKNEKKTDNRVENLEWATILEQNIYGTRIERVKAHTDYKNRGIDYATVASKHDYKNLNRNQMKPVLQFDKNGFFITRFDGVSEAARSLGLSAGHLCSCLKGRRKSCGGYRWKYA